MTLQYTCIEVTQPIGTFYLTKVPANVAVNRLRISPRRESSPTAEEVQRETSDARVREIANYVRDPDATFPTAIIIACESSTTTIDNGQLIFEDSSNPEADQYIGDLLDGQHRIRGLKLAFDQGVDISRFELPAVVMIDLDPSHRAYVFSIINSKQTPVNKSLIYDLFGLSTARSPFQTAHQVARAMNTKEGGPFYRGLKMLGSRKLPTEMLTQGSFVRSLVKLISSKPDQDAIALKRGEVPKESEKPFNAFFNKGKDELILKSMDNYFSAIQEAFPKDWDYLSYFDGEGKPIRGTTPVLRKTVGYEALMRALEMVWPTIKEQGSVEAEVFRQVVRRFRANVGDTALTTDTIGSSGADAGKLARLLVSGDALTS